MKNDRFYLGIDLGTSSVKGILKSTGGSTLHARQGYEADTPDGWKRATRSLIAELTSECNGEIAAIGFSSQVGTYVIDGRDVIPWHSGVGREEYEHLRSVISDREFESELLMRHPALVSYPLPRLLYIQKQFGKGHEVLMPKELLIRELTGQTRTDIFSMRGIANPERRRYAETLIQKAGIQLKLPPIGLPTELAGYVTETAAHQYGLRPHMPVYLGCNDFFAGLLGMGIYAVGDAFDLSGTSEHVGYIGKGIDRDAFVSGAYFVGSCSYGGTKSSGLCCDFAIKNFGIDGIDIDLAANAPIFLPYLNGERAPIFDDNARGVYFGIGKETDQRALAYAALEGVVFSLYDIASRMKAFAPSRLVCSGGSAKNSLMNRLRASLFGCSVVGVLENDTSALGACMLAMVGDGAYGDLSEAIADCVSYTGTVSPELQYRTLLFKRFSIYRELYGRLKPTFQAFQSI